MCTLFFEPRLKAKNHEHAISLFLSADIEVAECAVLGVPDETYGQIVAVLLAFKEVESLEMTDAKRVSLVRDWLVERLAKYKVPRVWKPVQQIPRNAMGKVAFSSHSDHIM